MTVRERLTAFALIIAEETERNGIFRRRVEAILGSALFDVPLGRDEKASSKKGLPSRVRSDALKKGGRRTPAILDPISLARQGEDVLRQKLAILDMEQLKDIVAENGMDPGKLVMKWKEAARVVDRIVEMSIARSTKGDAFRADKSPVEAAVMTPAESPTAASAEASDHKAGDREKQ